MVVQGFLTDKLLKYVESLNFNNKIFVMVFITIDIKHYLNLTSYYCCINIRKTNNY